MYRIDETICTGCGDCVEACPNAAITLVHGKAWIDPAACADCGSCAAVCSRGAIVSAITEPTYASGRVAAITTTASTAEVTSPVIWPEVEITPAVSHRSQFWPMVGGALVWASRELLPEVIASWRQAEARPSRRGAVRRRVATRRWNGRRHRWGRV